MGWSHTKFIPKCLHSSRKELSRVYESPLWVPTPSKITRGGIKYWCRGCNNGQPSPTTNPLPAPPEFLPESVSCLVCQILSLAGLPDIVFLSLFPSRDYSTIHLWLRVNCCYGLIAVVTQCRVGTTQCQFGKVRRVSLWGWWKKGLAGCFPARGS